MYYLFFSRIAFSSCDFFLPLPIVFYTALLPQETNTLILVFVMYSPGKVWYGDTVCSSHFSLISEFTIALRGRALCKHQLETSSEKNLSFYPPQTNPWGTSRNCCLLFAKHTLIHAARVRDKLSKHFFNNCVANRN